MVFRYSNTMVGTAQAQVPTQHHMYHTYMYMYMYMLHVVCEMW